MALLTRLGLKQALCQCFFFWVNLSSYLVWTYGHYPGSVVPNLSGAEHMAVATMQNFHLNSHDNDPGSV